MERSWYKPLVNVDLGGWLVGSGLSFLRDSILSPVTRPLPKDAIYPLTFPAVLRTSANFAAFFLQGCLSETSCRLTSGRHICFGLCFYLELRIKRVCLYMWDKHLCTHSCGFVVVRTHMCMHTCLPNLYCCMLTFVHVHMIFCMTSCAQRWVCI